MPGGRCDEGEIIETTLRREVQEEVGITDLIIEDFISELPGAKDGDVLHLFIGRTSQEPQLMEPEKFSEWKWENLDSIPENFIHPTGLKLIKDYLRKN